MILNGSVVTWCNLTLFWSIKKKCLEMNTTITATVREFIDHFLKFQGHTDACMCRDTPPYMALSNLADRFNWTK